MDKQRPSTNLLKNKPKGELTDKKFIKQINEDEETYAKYVNEFRPTPIRSPLDILAEGLGPKQKVGFSDADDFVNRQLLILNEVDKVVKGKPDSGSYLKNCLQLLKNENTKNFISSMKKKKRKMGKDAKEYKFQPPNEIVVLEKLGKIMKRVILRDCFMTKDKFGQIKKKKTDVLIKPTNFVENYVYLQNKKEVTSGTTGKSTAQNEQQRKREKELKARKLKWPDLKKFSNVKNTEWRVKFEEISKGRPRAIFLKDKKQSENLFNHVILKKLQKKDSNLIQKIQSLALVFKVKQAEYFYLQEIQPFVKSNYTLSHLKIINSTLEDAMEENEMGEGRKDRGGDDKSDFRLGNYKMLNKLAQGDFDDKKKLFATRIDEHLDFLDGLGEIDPSSLGRSPFKELDKGVSPTAREDALDVVKTDDDIFRVDGLQADDLGFNYLRLVISNSLVIVKLEKFILENRVDDESTKSIYKVEIVNTGSKEREGSECNSYKSAENKLYNTFETDISVKCPNESMNDVRVTITDLFSKKIVLDKTCNLMELLERVHMENRVCVNFFLGETDDDKQAKEDDPSQFEEIAKGVLVFNVVLFPTNLEIAHLLCKDEVLEKQFDNFDIALKEIQDFSSYREKFFQKDVQRNKLQKGDGKNVYYFRNNYIDKSHFYVEFQDDSLASAYRYNNLMWFKSTLGKVLSSSSIDLAVLTSDNIDRIDKDEPFGNDLVFDLYIRTIYLLSPSERVLMNRSIYQATNKNFYHNKDFNLDSSMKISRGLIKIINRDLETYFSKNDHLKRTQKEMIRNIVQRVFFFLSNNNIKGTDYSIHYSKFYIPLIASITLLNEQDVTDRDICLLSVNAIFSTTDISNYTFTNHINYLSNCVSYFKFLFKKLYPDQYIELTKLMVEFDLILANYLHNSFADVFDPVNLNIYLDLKNLLELLFTSNDKNIELIYDLKQFGIRFSSFFDIMFLLQSFAAMFEKFKYATEPNQIRLTMDTILIKQMQSSELTTKQILQLIEYIYDSRFFSNDYQFFQEGLTEFHLKTAKNFMQLKTAFRKANLDDKVVDSIIDDHLIKNNVFCLRLQSLFKNPGDLEDDEEDNKSQNNLKTDKKDLKNFESGYNNDDTVDEDIFFEVAEEAQPFYDDYGGKGDDAVAVRYLTCLVYLNNMDMALLDTMSNQHKLKANLNNLYELNEEEFSSIVRKYVKNVPESMIPRLFESLCDLSSSSRVPVLKLIILLSLSLTEDFSKTAEKLSNLVFILSSIIFREVASNNNKKAPYSIEEILTAIEKDDQDFLNEQSFVHFSEIVKYVITEVASLTPFNFFSYFVERLVDVQKPQVTTEIKHAKLHLGPQVIDITELCARHHVTSTYSEGKSCILFNDVFNDWMTDIFATLLKDNQIDENCTKFDVFLEAYIGNIIRHYRIPFRIVHVPEIQVFCKQNQRIYFENQYDEHYLLPKSTFVEIFRQLPFNFLDANLTSQIPCPFFDSERKLNFLFNVDSKQVTRVDISFKNVDLENPCDLITWAFKNPKPNLLFSIASDQISIALPYSVLFLPIKDLMYHVIQFILIHCKEMDFFKFIKMNLRFLDISTVSNKAVDPNLILPELKEYEKSVKINSDINLKVNINTSTLKQ